MRDNKEKHGEKDGRIENTTWAATTREALINWIRLGNWSRSIATHKLTGRIDVIKPRDIRVGYFPSPLRSPLPPPTHLPPSLPLGQIELKGKEENCVEEI